MHSREYLLGVAKLMRQRGQPIPLEMLIEAERLGLVLSEFDEPTLNVNDEGEIDNGE